MFKDNTIKRRVLAVVNGLIEQAQKEYETGVKDLDDKHEEAIAAMEFQLKNDKAGLENKLVDGIVSRFR